MCRAGAEKEEEVDSQQQRGERRGAIARAWTEYLRCDRRNGEVVMHEEDDGRIELEGSDTSEMEVVESRCFGSRLPPEAGDAMHSRNAGSRWIMGL